jgi:hypothetical protein
MTSTHRRALALLATLALLLGLGAGAAHALPSPCCTKASVQSAPVEASPVEAAPKHLAPKHLVAPSRVGAFDVSTYRTCYYGTTYRLALTIWWGQYGGGTTAPNLVQQRYQKWVNGAWTSYNWAASMNSDYRQGSTILDREGPLNPPASYDFSHGGASVGPSLANVRTRASSTSGAISIDCIQNAP